MDERYKKYEKDGVINLGTRYAVDVRDGEILACKFVVLACQRHLDDLDHCRERGLYFDKVDANKAIEFYKFCPHFKGEWAGTVISLEPWQMFIISNVFGWKYKETELRRFKVAYITVARKNGKTTMLAPVGLYMLTMDSEPGAEIYSAAVDRDQAREIFDAAKAMVDLGELSKIVKTLTRNMSVEKTMSKFEPLSADEKKQHGKNIHGALCDELHVWPKHSLWSVLRTGMGARRQPIQWAITTAGSDQSSICYQVHDYASQILKGFKDGAFTDDSFFGIIYTLDQKTDWHELQTKDEHRGDPTGIVEDDWTNPECWVKANPNLGISVKLKDMEDEARVARQMPTSQNDFMRLRMNVWTQSQVRWISLEKWDLNFTTEVYIYES